jgi:hypothetical protein
MQNFSNFFTVSTSNGYEKHGHTHLVDVDIRLQVSELASFFCFQFNRESSGTKWFSYAIAIWYLDESRDAHVIDKCERRAVDD